MIKTIPVIDQGVTGEGWDGERKIMDYGYVWGIERVGRPPPPLSTPSPNVVLFALVLPHILYDFLAQIGQGKSQFASLVIEPIQPAFFLGLVGCFVGI